MNIETITRVEQATGVTLDQMLTKDRKQATVYPRQLLIYALRFIDGMSTIELGHEFDLDHTTVVHSCNVIYNYIRTDPHRREQIYRVMGYDLPGGKRYD